MQVGLALYGLDGATGLSAVQLRAAALFLGSCIQLCLPYVSLLAYTAHAAHVRREAHARLYGASPLLLSKLATTLPVNLACVVGYAAVAYGLLGLRPTWVAALQHTGLAALLVLCSAQVMHLAVVACASTDTAFMVTTAWGVLQMFFSGADVIILCRVFDVENLVATQCTLTHPTQGF
jgi:hypothetical protein